MKKPSIEEVKEYFENVKEVECLSSLKIIDLQYMTDKGLHDWSSKWWIDYENHPNLAHPNNSCLLFDIDKGYAKIISYKTQKFEITKDQISKIHNLSSLEGKRFIKDLFPIVFEVELEVGKWYKSPYCGGSLFCITDLDNIRNRYISGYGTEQCYGWQGLKKDYWWLDKGYTEATPEEVFEALKSEAKKRGFKDGCHWIEPINQPIYDSKIRLAKGKIQMYGDELNKLCFSLSDSLIFKDGIWATIIETITKAEAEQKLNCKII